MKKSLIALGMAFARWTCLPIFNTGNYFHRLIPFYAAISRFKPDLVNAYSTSIDWGTWRNGVVRSSRIDPYEIVAFPKGRMLFILGLGYWHANVQEPGIVIGTKGRSDLLEGSFKIFFVLSLPVRRGGLWGQLKTSAAKVIQRAMGLIQKHVFSAMPFNKNLGHPSRKSGSFFGKMYFRTFHANTAMF